MSSWRRATSLAHHITRRYLTTEQFDFNRAKERLLGQGLRIYHDYLTPTHSNLLALSLLPPTYNGNELPSHKTTDNLPQGYHTVYFPPTHPNHFLLKDGTDQDHFPGYPFVRRLWTGGSLEFRDTIPAKRLILDGRHAVCVENVDDVREYGKNILIDTVRQFAVLDQETGASNPAIIEKRTLCFLPDKSLEEIRNDLENPRKQGLKNRGLPPNPTYTLTIRITQGLLFRFSSLSFNAHTIHYNRQYCREVEGHPNLLAHGPLLLTLMCEALTEAHLSTRPLSVLVGQRRKEPFIRTISYRNWAPVYVNEEIKVCCNQSTDTEWDIYILGPDDSLRTKGSATCETHRAETNLDEQ